MSDGESKSQETTYKEKLKQFEEILKKYTETLGFHKIIYNVEVEPILQLTRDELYALSPKDCSVYSYLLAQYSLCLRKELDLQKVRKDWAELELNRLVALDKSDNQYIKFDIQKAKLIANNSAANILGEIIKHAGARYSQLEGISEAVYFMSTRIKSLCYNYENRND